MASFEKAIKIVLKHEGGYADDPTDRGGETYRGISRRYHPRWEGWKIVDDHKSWMAFPESLATDLRLEPLVIKFYRDEFWKYGGLVSQKLANKVFDAAVNMDSPNAHRILQRALRQVGFKVKVDGAFGPKTLRAANSANLQKLLLEFRAYACVYYAKIVARKPKQVKWIYGWMRRAVS